METKNNYLSPWIAALKSGQYDQTCSQLQHNYDGERSYCCLGVLCDVVPEITWDEEDAPSPYAVYEIKGDNLATLQDEEGFLFFDTELTSDVFTKLTGLPNDLQIVLIRLNDAGASFIDIARLIESDFDLAVYDDIVNEAELPLSKLDDTRSDIISYNEWTLNGDSEWRQ